MAYFVRNDGWLASFHFVKGGDGWDLWPTAKWWTATMIALIGFPIIWWVTGYWTRDLTGQAITIVGQRVLAYIVPNNPVPNKGS
jgi:hypothetical protein